MKLFDLHCDTIERMEELGEDMLTDKTQLSLKYLPQMEKWCQTFAIFIPDSKRGADAVSYYEQVLAYFHKMLQKHADIVEMANTADDIRRITGSKKCAALLSVEGGAVLVGKLENIEKLKKDGVKMMTLTWNGANELASGSVNPEMGFTAFGREAVKEMERQNIIVDVSHLNDKGMEELMGFATKPIIATHSNLRSVCSHKRNVTEEMFKYIVEHKGLCGLNLLHGFVSDEPMKDSKAELFRHFSRVTGRLDDVGQRGLHPGHGFACTDAVGGQRGHGRKQIVDGNARCFRCGRYLSDAGCKLPKGGLAQVLRHKELVRQPLRLGRCHAVGIQGGR